MSARSATLLAWSACAAALSLLALASVLVYLGWSTPLPEGWLSWQALAIQCAGMAGAPVLGGLVASRRPENPYGWLWLAFGLGVALLAFAQAYAAYALVVEPGSMPFPRTVGTQVAGVGWVARLSFPPLLLLLFPTGRPPSRRWRFVAWAVVAAGAVALFSGFFLPGEGGFGAVENPWGSAAS